MREHARRLAGSALAAPTPACLVALAGRAFPGRRAVVAAGWTAVGVVAVATVTRTAVAATIPGTAARHDDLTVRADPVEVDLAASVDLGDLYLDLVADVHVVLDALDALRSVAHLRDVQQS